MAGLGEYRLVRRRLDWAIAKDGQVVASYAGQGAAEAAAHALALVAEARPLSEPRSFAEPAPPAERAAPSKA
jgi:hypothetical protein